MTRWPIAFIILGLVAAGLAYDRAVEVSAVEQTSATEQVVVSPSLADPPRLDGAWYCPLGSSTPDGFADHEVNISNLSTDSAVANLSILTSEGPGPSRRIELGPFATERITIADTQVADVAGAVVEITGGKGVVGHSVTTAEGVAEGPCATHASSTWYFAGGRTTADSSQYLALMNPFPETAVFDVEFRALGRSREPGPLTGAFVEARSIRIIDVGEFVSREEALATKITTNRGRLVVERLQVLNGDLGASGAALQLGVPTPAPSWIFTAGRVHESGDDLLTVFNPYEVDDLAVLADSSDDDEAEEAEDAIDDAEIDDAALDTDQAAVEEPDPLEETNREGFVTVSVELWPTNPTDLSTFSVVTIEREVRPGNFVTIDLRAQAERFEFPLPYELGVNVTSNEGLPIVAERWQFGEQVATDGLTVDVDDETEEPADGEEAPADGEEEVAADGEEEAAGEEADPDAEAPADGEEEAEETAEGEEETDETEPVEIQPPEPVESDLPQPIASTGISTTRGNELFSTEWVVPWVTISGDSTLIAVAAIEEAAVEVRVLENGELVGPVRATVAAGGRAIIPLTSSVGGGAVQVVSDRPISVEAVVVLPDQSLDVVPGVPTVIN